MLSAALLTVMAAVHRHRSRLGGVIINEHTLTRAATREHVDALRRSFDFVHHDEVLDRLEHPKSRPFCLLTFDDGKRSVYTDTAPELERLGVPAVFYVTSRFISEGVPLWFDRYEALLASSHPIPRGLHPTVIKELPHALLTERVERACAKYGVSVDMSDDTIRPMSWDDARDLVRRGFTVGAHSLRHAVLTRESESEAHRDIEQCIAEVSKETRTPCVTFAFPNGNYTARLAQHALACGVKTVMTTEPVWASCEFQPWRLPRIQLFGTQSRFKIELKLALATAGCILQNPDGSGRLYRHVIRLSRARPPFGSVVNSRNEWESMTSADTLP